MIALRLHEQLCEFPPKPSFHMPFHFKASKLIFIIEGGKISMAYSERYRSPAVRRSIGYFLMTPVVHLQYCLFNR